MKREIHRFIKPALGALIISAGVGVACAADSASDPATGFAQQRQEWAQHRMEWVRARLEIDANRLEIKASQQAAWQEYAKARTALDERNVTPPAKDLDPAALAKLHADRATEIAKKLSALAEATAKLQAVLSPEQRLTLAQISRHGWHHHHGWRDGAHGFCGEGPHDGLDGHGMREHAEDELDDELEDEAAAS
jgi:hypothetical protein